MDYQELATLIGSLGFPIVMCLYMTIKFNDTLDKLENTVLSLSTKVETLLEKGGRDGTT